MKESQWIRENKDYAIQLTCLVGEFPRYILCYKGEYLGSFSDYSSALLRALHHRSKNMAFVNKPNIKLVKG
jgi:hypothetical protein